MVARRGTRVGPPTLAHDRPRKATRRRIARSHICIDLGGAVPVEILDLGTDHVAVDRRFPRRIIDLEPRRHDGHGVPRRDIQAADVKSDARQLELLVELCARRGWRGSGGPGPASSDIRRTVTQFG